MHCLWFFFTDGASLSSYIRVQTVVLIMLKYIPLSDELFVAPTDIVNGGLGTDEIRIVVNSALS